VSRFLSQDSRETHTNLTDSFRLERGGQFESGFQKCLTPRIKIIVSIHYDILLTAF
jgi:hypothetical protein